MLYHLKNRVHKVCTIELCNKLVWTDDSKLEIFGSNRRVDIQQRISERAAIPYITPTVKHGGIPVMVWEAFAICKVGDLHHVKNKLNQTSYHSILQHYVITSGMRLVDQEFVFMQDNDPKHTNKLCQRYIKSK